MDWLDDLVDRFIIDADDATLARQSILGMNQGGALGAAAFLESCRIVGEAAEDPAALIVALDGLGVGDMAAAIGALVIRTFAAIRADYPSRPDAQAARTSLSVAADAVYDTAGALYGADIMAWLVRLVGVAIVEISAIAAARAPLVRVETGISLPSSLLAYDLYGDPDRGRELVVRNRIGTPFIMPAVLEALAE